MTASQTSFSRRAFCKYAVSAGVALASFSALSRVATFAAENGGFALPPLPYAEDALAPHISAQTISFHYGKHTKAYYDTVNKMIAEKGLAGLSLEKIFLDAAKSPDGAALFNNAAQAFNHTFYWQGLTPGGAKAPSGKLARLVDQSFGSFDALKKELTAAAVSQFGSGWAWLVREGDALKVVKTSNAENPLQKQQTPLLTIDVWEHAYYLDYQNRRPDYVKAVLENLVNWDIVAAHLG